VSVNAAVCKLYQALSKEHGGNYTVTVTGGGRMLAKSAGVNAPYVGPVCTGMMAGARRRKRRRRR
jgi:hypothetical protein